MTTTSSTPHRASAREGAAGFAGILFPPGTDGGAALRGQAPDCFGDLNLDQVVEMLTSGLQEYDLAPFFYSPAPDLATVTYRHEVLADLAHQPLREALESFAKRMHTMRTYRDRAETFRDTQQKRRWFLESGAVYCDAVATLAGDLGEFSLDSPGFGSLLEFLDAYVSSATFRTLHEQTDQLREDLSRVRYSVHIEGNRVNVDRYADEVDYGAQVLATFEKFQQGNVKDYLVDLPNYAEVNHVEARILGLVAQLYPDTFTTLERYCSEHRNYLDATVRDFDRQIQFYLSYLRYIAPLQEAGLPFCAPEVSDSKAVCAEQTFDLALARQLVQDKSPTVCNDFFLEGAERVIVVSGPNQGGKTAFARTFGQLHYLADLGLPVPGTTARLFLFDHLLTHFEKQEDLGDLSGKLHDDLVRIHDILQRASDRSVVILNEIFTSTTLDDAKLLGTKVLQQVIERDLLCVCVTFVDELASLSDSTVSMVSTVVPDDPATRTYKIVRKPADGLAYAAAIAAKYGLTYEDLKRRVAS